MSAAPTRTPITHGSVMLGSILSPFSARRNAAATSVAGASTAYSSIPRRDECGDARDIELPALRACDLSVAERVAEIRDQLAGERNRDPVPVRVDELLPDRVEADGSCDGGERARGEDGGARDEHPPCGTACELSCEPAVGHSGVMPRAPGVLPLLLAAVEQVVGREHRLGTGKTSLSGGWGAGPCYLLSRFWSQSAFSTAKPSQSLLK